MTDTDALELQAATANAVVNYLRSFGHLAGQGRTSAVDCVAETATAAGSQPGSLGPSWELAEAWETAHRALEADGSTTACPCAEHTAGSVVTLANLARLVAVLRPSRDMVSAVAAIEDEERFRVTSRA